MNNKQRDNSVIKKDLEVLEKRLMDKLASKEELQATNMELGAMEKRLIEKLASKEEIAAVRQELIEKLASKEELAAVRQELIEKLASKEELAAARQELIEKLASKKDLSKTNSRLDKLTSVVIQNNQDIKDIKEILASHDHKLDMLLEAVTDFAGEVKDERVEKTATQVTLTRHEKQLQDHETRICKVEEKVA